MKHSYISLLALLLSLALFAVYIRRPTARELERRQTATNMLLRQDLQYAYLQDLLLIVDDELRRNHFATTSAPLHAQKSDLERKLLLRRDELLPQIAMTLQIH